MLTEASSSGKQIVSMPQNTPEVVMSITVFIRYRIDPFKRDV